MHGNVLAVTAEDAKPTYDITILSTGGFGPPISRNMTIMVADYTGTTRRPLLGLCSATPTATE